MAWDKSVKNMRQFWVSQYKKYTKLLECPKEGNKDGEEP